MQEQERMELVPSRGKVWQVSATRWVTNVEWTITARKMRNAVSVAVNSCVWTQKRLTRKLKPNQDCAQSLGWVRKVYVIAVVICAVKMSTARVASYVVLMDANWTALTLVSNEIRLLLKAMHVRANGHNIVGQQLPTFLDVTCYVRLHTLLLLRKVWNRSNFYLRANGCNNSQSCWPTMLRTFALWGIGERFSQCRKTCWFCFTKFFRS